MSPKAQRQAVAESCGFKGCCGYKYDTCPAHGSKFLSDINAMHRVERTLKLSDRELYLSWLGQITEKGRMAPRSWTNVNATAAQRAEAYLRTIGKWKD